VARGGQATGIRARTPAGRRPARHGLVSDRPATSDLPISRATDPQRVAAPLRGSRDRGLSSSRLPWPSLGRQPGPQVRAVATQGATGTGRVRSMGWPLPASRGIAQSQCPPRRLPATPTCSGGRLRVAESTDGPGDHRERSQPPTTARCTRRSSVSAPTFGLAVDDAGAGVANFDHLAELRPDLLKIDIGLVRGVDADLGRRAVVAGLVPFAVASGCQVIAEGIETDAELAMVRNLGVAVGQGYLLARPAGAESWAVAEPAKRRAVAASRRPHRRTAERPATPASSRS
jgi:EAL domain